MADPFSARPRGIEASTCLKFSFPTSVISGPATWKTNVPLQPVMLKHAVEGLQDGNGAGGMAAGTWLPEMECETATAFFFFFSSYFSFPVLFVGVCVCFVWGVG